jgi:phage terminase large subunit-like protein
MTGRGFGKTRAGGQWCHERAMEHPGRWIAIIGKTPADVRDYQIEGPSGILRNVPKDECPKYHPSKRRVVWPNGSWGTVYSAEEPEQTRGFSGDTAWLDEFAKWNNASEVWTNLMFGMREASDDKPRVCISTTPRPLPVLREIANKPSTTIVRGSSYENRGNLDPSWFADTLSEYEGTHLAEQEIYGKILDEAPGAHWTRQLVEDQRRKELPTLIKKAVVGVDPSMSSGPNSDECGIVACGIGDDGFGYILDDTSLRATPDGWGTKVVSTYDKWHANFVIAEKNQGGDLVEHVIRTVRPYIPYKGITAKKSKMLRAEPVAALFEQSRIFIIGHFPQLEDEMCTFDPEEAIFSPNRLDAMVYAFYKLFPLEAKPRRARRLSVSYSSLR